MKAGVDEPAIGHAVDDIEVRLAVTRPATGDEEQALAVIAPREPR